MNPDLLILFTGEILIILVLYRFVLRQWVVAEWEAKFDEENWLVERLEPVIDEIDLRTHDKLQAFQDSFFGSVGAMTKKAQELDPMNNIRKAAKNSDWTSLLVEYAANKAGLGAFLTPGSDKTAENSPKIAPTVPLPKPIKDMMKL